ncbi:SRPBCC family protein [Pandoraea bronchicola]|uniref:Polyketide cyclase n=1 Tax=Pandoraea bronchicola TaxID=2508287 RepID=A0A5E5BYF4_9BURK|nr:SRPBCC family protein [Pandoraea bronchicola]VVE89383.1 polyketide cyclase [Pandoraea bronchicola]
MRTASEAAPAAQPRPLSVGRTYAATRETVFRAWTTADAVKRWFCPTGYTVPEATIDARVGGAFALKMQSPEGESHWIRGRFVEIDAPKRLVIDMDVTDAKGTALFGALTTAAFTDVAQGTRLDVEQRYTVHDPAYAWMPEGAGAGWAQTLDKLGREVMREAGAPAQRSVVHSTFRIERQYPASPARVFRALAEREAKDRWFARSEGLTVVERSMEVRPGGRERVKGRWASGMESTFDAVYFDVVPDTRLVYAYEMHLDTRKISASLATIDLRAHDGGTHLVMTEQGAFLDGYDDAGSRERGTQFLLDALGASLAD